MSNYRYFAKDYIPSDTKMITISETEYYSLKWPAGKVSTPKRFYPIDGEIWKAIGQGWPDTYFISDLGRIKNLRTMKNGRHVFTEVRGSLRRDRKTIAITKGKTIIKDDVARVMLKAFDPRPNYRPLQAIAIDGNNLNVALSNFTWMPLKEAREYLRKIGAAKPKLKTKNVIYFGKWKERKVRFDDNDVSEMNRLVDAGISNKKIAEIFDCGQELIRSNVLTYKKRFKHYELPDRSSETGEDNQSDKG